MNRWGGWVAVAAACWLVLACDPKTPKPPEPPKPIALLGPLSLETGHHLDDLPR